MNDSQRIAQRIVGEWILAGDPDVPSGGTYLIARIAAALDAAQPKWQPADSAPSGRVVLGFWSPDLRKAVTPECYGLCQYFSGEWESPDGESWAAPDAWMFLPAPPEKG